MPSRAEIVTFDDSPPPFGATAWVTGAPRAIGIEVTDPDPGWPQQYRDLAARIREALGWRALQLDHVGSTSVPGLAAKPVIDIDLTVADPGHEQDYIPALEKVGFRLVIREPWWYGHRVLRADEPRCNLHVFGFDSPELVKHRIFRDWLRVIPGSAIVTPPPSARPQPRPTRAESTRCNTTPASSRSSGRSITGRSWLQACSRSKIAAH
jgi:GrpB-like predicted nucleotidyltransferase (UPF0157 family)